METFAEYMKKKRKKDEDDIAPVREDKNFFKLVGDTVSDGFVQLGDALSDGYDFGDITKTFLGTDADIATDLASGVVGWGEKAIDAGATLVGNVTEKLGMDGAMEKIRDFATKDLYDENEVARKILSSPVTSQLLPGMQGVSSALNAIYTLDDWLNKGRDNSFLGAQGNAVIASGAESVAKKAITAAAGGIPVGDIITGVTVYGAQAEEALKEDATFAQAGGSGLISAAAEVLIEKFSGGIKIGGYAVDEGLRNLLLKNISNVALKTAINMGFDIVGEGAEEAVTEFVSKLGTKLYKEEDLGEILLSEDALKDYIRAFVSGGAMGAAFNAPGAVSGIKNKTDYKTDLSENEQKVADKVYKDRLAERDGEKLSTMDKAKIYEEVMKDMREGNISIDTIEEVLGGDDYKTYKDTVANEKKLSDELQELRQMKSSDMNDIQRDRLAELKGMDLKTGDGLKSQLEQKTRDMLSKERNGKGSYLTESYNERARRGQAFEADLNQYSEKQRETVQKAIDSGVLNNTRKIHNMVDMVAKLHEETGLNFDFTSNEKLKGTPMAMNGKTTNGYYVDSTGTIVLNANSAKMLNTVVGHEVTHALEKVKGYDNLMTFAKAYAKDFDARVAKAMEAYKTAYKNADEAKLKAMCEQEVVADIVGDSLFSDAEFVRQLSTTDRNLFQKIYDEIKHLCKLATAGSKEARELERVEKTFKDVLRERAKTQKSEASKATSENVKGQKAAEAKFSFSSIAYTFFGNEKMTADEFEAGDYKQTKGYKECVEQFLNNLRQSRADFNEAEARKEIEGSIDGIVRVAVAAKRAGYDIEDRADRRSVRDSKNRLLFSSLEPNSDYFTSHDISTICDKRENFAEIYDDIVRAEEAKGVPSDKRFFNNIDNYFYLHKVLADKGLTAPCRECYVESMRKNLAPMANAFLKLVTEPDPDNTSNDQLYHQRGKKKGELKVNNASTREFVLSVFELHPEYNMTVNDLTVEKLTTEKGLAELKIKAPLIYEAFNSFYGQSKPKMPKAATPFRFGELTALLTDDEGKINKKLVDRINSTGGFRLQSYSDFQNQNYADVLQVLFEAGTLGLKGHAYTKVPAFLDATAGTNLKRNISIFMYKDGDEWKIDMRDSFPGKLESIYERVKADKSGNTGIIAVSQNEDMSAWIMANDLIGYGIPFHKSGMKMDTVRSTIVREGRREILGYKDTKDHTKQQTEVWAETTGDHKKLTKVNKGINIYGDEVNWDFDNKSNLSKNELIEKNVKAYINACNKAGYLPKFREYLMNNGTVLNNVLKYAKKLGYVSESATIDDISFEYSGYKIPYGYYKFLGDFGMFTPDGKASPHEVLSLKNYDFDNAVKFFEDRETRKRNEVLQQFDNGEERQKYQDSNMTAEELREVVKQKRGEVVKEILGDDFAPIKLSLSEASDTDYLSAVERGDMDTAQKMVDEAAKNAGYTVKAYHGTPIKGITTFDDAKIGSTTDNGIFGHGFYFSTNKLTADGYATTDGATMPTFLRVEKPWWGAGHTIGEVAERLDLSESMLTTRKVGGRTSIVAPFAEHSRAFASHLKERGYDSVIVQHGKGDYEIVIFDNASIKSADPVTYDNDGNVIPLSERFNSENSDIRYSLSEGGEAPANQDLVQEIERVGAEREAIQNEAEQLNRDAHAGVITWEEYRERVAGFSKRWDELNAEWERLMDAVEVPTKATEADPYAPMTEDEANAWFDEAYENLGAPEAPMEAPYINPEDVTPVDPFESRDIKAVGNQKVKAYMYENPEVKPFFQREAEVMLGELERTTKGERLFDDDVYYETNGEGGFGGTSRQTTADIAYLLDELDYSYAEIEKGLKAIIEDNGAENNACSKRIEFLLNDRLMNGHEDIDGMEIPANQDYINLLAEKQITEYSQEAREKVFAEPEVAPEPVKAEEPKAEDIAPVKAEEPEEEPRVARVLTRDEVTPPKQKGWKGFKARVKDTAQNAKEGSMKARRSLVDKFSVFEDLSFKTKNHELRAKANFMRSSEARAQYFIAHGAESEGVRALTDIMAEVGESEHDFDQYLRHKHNIDRMSLEANELPHRQEVEAKMEKLGIKDLDEDQLRQLAEQPATRDKDAETIEKIKTAREYLKSLQVKNKPVFGESITADVSREMVAEYESQHPEFVKWAKDIYGINKYLRKMLVDNGEITQETADLWEKVYPYYVPIKRAGTNGNAINVPLDTRKTGVDAPVKRAVGGDSDIEPLFKTMAERTEQTFKAVAKNSFGVELKNTLGTTVSEEASTLDEAIESVDQHEEMLKKGENGKPPTFTVFENGKRVEFEITEEMYRALSPAPDALQVTDKVLNKVGNIRRGLITEYNPAFAITNPIRDAQDVLMNSKHPVQTYKNFPKAIKELKTKGKWYQEYMANGGEQNTYFDSQEKTFAEADKGIKRIVGIPLRKMSEINQFSERIPRLAEYIASREAGASIEKAMLDSAEVTTNFQAGGDLTKFLNRNGATFLNASVQGAAQQVRNIREAKMNGLKGWAQLAGKCLAMGLPAVILNSLLWDDDEEYEELSDYIKDNYYIVAKMQDGTFVRIPKGRTAAVIQDAFEQMGNLVTGNDEVDLQNFCELVISNLAPNNPLDNNVISPIIQAVANKAWHGGDIVPQRLQDVPNGEQYDETTDAISKWLGEKINVSPMKLNYLLDQYSGAVGDFLLPVMTPAAESGSDSFWDNAIAPVKDKFTADAVLDNGNVGEFYDLADELAKKANSSRATDEDKAKYKYINSVKAEISDLYKQKREIQNSNLSNSAKYAKIRAIQEEINALAREALESYEYQTDYTGKKSSGRKSFSDFVDGKGIGPGRQSFSSFVSKKGGKS